MSHHPHTIDNGAGERLMFVGIRSDEEGEYLEARNSVSPGSGPPMHVHHLQEEVLTVERGTMGWQRLGEAEHLARSGDSARFAPGEVHRFWNAGDDELICTGFVRPPDIIGRLLGLRRRFADAPEPVSRPRPAATRQATRSRPQAPRT
jgi:quercetin dioxygenase-like cupin family protein